MILNQPPNVSIRIIFNDNTIKLTTLVLLVPLISSFSFGTKSYFVKKVKTVLLSATCQRKWVTVMFKI